jgi:AcrR family transcriptional regulator
MGRIKTVSDEAALDALLAAVSETGPEGLSFSKASTIVGLSASSLVQRFGSREGMVRAVLLYAWDRLDALTLAATSDTPETPAGAAELLLRLMPGPQTETDVTEGLLLLREDFRDPVLRARGAAWGRRLAAVLGERLTPGSPNCGAMGWQMLAVWQGSIIWWGFTRDKDPEEAVRTALMEWWQSVRNSGRPSPP